MRPIAFALLLVCATGCGGSGGDEVRDRSADRATAEDVRRAFSAEGLELFASTIDGRQELLPSDGAPFVVLVLPSAAEARRAVAFVNDTDVAGSNRFNRARANVVVYSDGGLTETQKQRIMAALARIGPAAETDGERPSSADMRALRNRHARRAPRLESLATAVLPAKPTVYCWDEAGWNSFVPLAQADDESTGDDFAGIASPASFRIELPSWVCETLERLPDEIEGIAVEDAASALDVLVHEAHHLTAIAPDEALTECLALQSIDDAATAIGLSDEWGRRLTRIAWRELYPTLSDEYRSPECRAGGSYDREPETPEFP